MNCADLESLLCEYVEGALAGPERAQVEEHLRVCQPCAALARDATEGLALARRAAPVEPPPQLLTRLLFLLSEQQGAARARSGFAGKLLALLRPLMQPRFAMGMAMTILSLSLLGRVAGLQLRQLTPSDLHPARLWQSLDQRAHRSWERARKFYAGLRLVYEIQVQLHEWMQEMREQRAAVSGEQGSSASPPSAPEQKGDQHP